jgi:hypothetical protein
MVIGPVAQALDHGLDVGSHSATGCVLKEGAETTLLG